MVVDLMVERIWPVARRVVLSWNDRASEIFILDLPQREVGRVLDEITVSTDRAVVLRFDGINLDQEKTLTPELKRSLVRASVMSTVHSLRGQLTGQANCYFYFWLDAERETLEVEMVFWNDLCFPAGKSLNEHKAMLGRLLRIAHRIRGDNHQCKCILSPEYNSEPRELLEGHSREVAIW